MHPASPLAQTLYDYANPSFCTRICCGRAKPQQLTAAAQEVQRLIVDRWKLVEPLPPAPTRTLLYWLTVLGRTHAGCRDVAMKLYVLVHAKNLGARLKIWQSWAECSNAQAFFTKATNPKLKPDEAKQELAELIEYDFALIKERAGEIPPGHLATILRVNGFLKELSFTAQYQHISRFGSLMLMYGPRRRV